MQGPLGYPSVATFSKVIIEGSAGGLFAYNTAPPTTGSLAISIAAEQGTDQWNNFYLPGITVWSGSYPNNPYVNIQNGTIFFGGGQATGGSINTSGGGTLQIRSPLAVAGDTAAIVLLFDSLVSHISPTPTVELLETGLTFSNGSGSYIDITQNSNNQLQIDQTIFGEAEIIALTTFITLNGGSSGNTSFAIDNLSEPDPYFSIDGLGGLHWGPGSSATDTSLTRTGAGSLFLTGATGGSTFTLLVEPTTTGVGGIGAEMQSGSDFAIAAYTAGDSIGDPHFVVRGNGQMEWGPGGSSPVDTSLTRSSAATLQVNDAMFADSFHDITTGFLAGFTGQLQYKYLVEQNLIFLRFRFTVAVNTTLTEGTSVIYTMPSGYYFTGDNTVLQFTMVQGTTNSLAVIYLNSNGNLTWESATTTTTANPGYLYGQNTYSTAA